ncbi:MAG TPA: DUF2231 domain-containing protein [Ignavibacteriaceae bacterium]|nr:DUF2231 domain-containing protein [Ignavibacteriaceae bacterium]
MDSFFLAEVHPKVVHFPVALLTTYSFLEIIGIVFKKEFISKAALLILCIGVITAFFAVLTGNQAFADFKFWTDDSSALLNDHQNYATYLLWLSVLVCGFRVFVVLKKKFFGITKYLFILFAIMILFLVYQTGMHGGDLVKKFGIGTDVFETKISE